MPNVGTITGSMVLDPSAYISGLNQAAVGTRSFQANVNSISFAGFNRGMFATTTLLYGMNRIMSSMSKGMEEYSNMLGRIGTVADMTAASVSALADAMKGLSVRQGVLRTDIMGGMYTAAQSGFSTPAEMRAMATSGALLSRASGKEINVKKSTDLLATLRQALGIGNESLRSGRTTDLLLRSRDIGRWELDQMAEALGKVATVYGNQFNKTLGGDETLRQIASIMSVASLSGLPLGMVSTGTRRMAERTFQLSNTARGDPLREALRGIGYGGKNPVMQAYSRGPMNYLMDLVKLSGGSSDELYRLGYQSRELSTLTSSLRNKGGELRSAYGQLSYANTAGTTEKYNERMLQTYDAKRDQLRAQWMITSQEFMQAALPFISQFTSVLQGLNVAAQSLPSSVKSFMLLIGALTSLRFAMNLFGFRSAPVSAAIGGAGKMAGSGLASGIAAMSAVPMPQHPGWNMKRGSGNLSGFADAYTIARQKQGSKLINFFNDPDRKSSAVPLGPSRPNAAVWQRMQQELANQRGYANWLLSRPKPSLYERFQNNFSVQPDGFKSESYGGNSLFGGIGKATKGLVGSIESAIGPIAKFAIVTAAASKLIEGFVYRGTPDNVSGKQSLAINGGRPGILSTLGHGLNLAGSFANNGFKEMPNLARDYARKYGYVPIGSGKKADDIAATGKPSLAKLLFDSTFLGLGSRALGFGTPLGLEGYRRGNMSDVASAVSRESITPDMVRRLSKGGIDFSNFETIRPYMNAHMKDLGFDTTTDWQELVKSEDGFDKAMQLMANALKRVAEKLAAAADKLNAAGDHWLGPWKQGVGGSMIGDNILNSRILQGRQWDIYSGSEYAKPGEYGALNWNAGGRDYRKLYNAGLEELNQNYGNFSSPSWTEGARRAIDQRSQLWRDRAGGFAGSIIRGINGGFTSNDPNIVGPTQFRSSTNDPNFVGPKLVRPTFSVTRASAFPNTRGLDVEDPYKYMLEKGDEAIRNNSRLKNFLKVMPDIGTMPEAEARGWFERMTGRSSSSDAFGEANFQNFRNMRVSDYVDVKQTGFPTQYAQATQFGTADAYNQLLPRQDPTEKLVFAIDKLDKYFETLSTDEEGRQTELDKVTNLALQFLSQPDMQTFFTNVAEMAADARHT